MSDSQDRARTRHYAVLRDPAKARGYFYMRDPSFERSVPNAHVKDFEAESFDAGQRMERLKETIKEVMPPQCYYDYYPCSWKGMVDGKVRSERAYTGSAVADLVLSFFLAADGGRPGALRRAGPG